MSRLLRQANSSTADAELMLLPAPSAETIEVIMLRILTSLDAMQRILNSEDVAVCWEQSGETASARLLDQHLVFDSRRSQDPQRQSRPQSRCPSRRLRCVAPDSTHITPIT